MKSSRRPQKSLYRSFEEFVWNIIGGSLVVSMLAGVFYLLTALIASELYGVYKYWEINYFIAIFAALLLFYLLLPKLFIRVLALLIGTTSSRDTRRY